MKSVVSRVIIGAGRKASHTCHTFNLWDEVVQFFEEPMYVGEAKQGKPVSDKVLKTGNLFAHSFIGEPRDKRLKVRMFEQACRDAGVGYWWGVLIHESAVVTNPKRLGVDVVIRPNAVVCSRAVIGDHVDIGNLCNVEHDVEIGDYSIVTGRVSLCGGVTVGRGVFIGQGASVAPNLTIGDGAVIGLGAVVVRDVPENTVVAGNPAHHNPKFSEVEPWNRFGEGET